MLRHQLGSGAHAGEDPPKQQLGLAVSSAPCHGNWEGHLVMVRKGLAGPHSLGSAPKAPSKTSMHGRPVLLCVLGTPGIPGQVINRFQGEACDLAAFIKENIAMVTGGKVR